VKGEKSMSASNETRYIIREVAAIFSDATKLEQAITALQENGFDRRDISVMASQAAIETKLGHQFEPIEAMETDPRIPRTVFVSKGEAAEGLAAAVGIPLYIGAIGSTIAVAATGGSLALAIIAAAAGGAAGGSVGGVIAKVLGRKHAERIEANLAAGGLILWVRIRDDLDGEKERRAMTLLEQAGGTSIDAHNMERTWSVDDIPLHDWQPDPLLEKGPDYQ
jgi:hypothetical protein